MTEIKVVIKWEKLNNLNEVDKLNGENDYGVYQIMGYHCVFGYDSMLYIGLSKDQSFCRRIGQHKAWLEQEGDVTIYVGRVDSIDDNSDYTEKNWSSIINDVEALLIYYHSPPYNSQYISECPTPKKPLRIINIGDYGDLYPELSHEGLKLENLPPRPKE